MSSGLACIRSTTIMRGSMKKYYNGLRPAAVLTFATALMLLVCTPLLASEQSDVVAKIHQFVDGFNRGDAKAALAACAPSASIIDEFPPHEWDGVNACAHWADAYSADAKKN